MCVRPGVAHVSHLCVVRACACSVYVGVGVVRVSHLHVIRASACSV